MSSHTAEVLITAVVACLLWAAAYGYCFVPAAARLGKEPLKSQRGDVVLQTILLPIALLIFLLERLFHYQSYAPRKRSSWLQRLDARMGVCFLLFMCVLLTFMGFLALFKVAHIGQALVLLLGLGLPVAAVVALRNQRRWRGWLIKKNHRSLAWFYHLIVLAAIAVGILVLIYGF